MSQVYCYCKKPESPGMVACDHRDCIDWYHYECLGIKKASVLKQAKYFCPEHCVMTRRNLEPLLGNQRVQLCSYCGHTSKFQAVRDQLVNWMRRCHDETLGAYFGSEPTYFKTDLAEQVLRSSEPDVYREDPEFHQMRDKLIKLLSTERTNGPDGVICFVPCPHLRLI